MRVHPKVSVIIPFYNVEESLFMGCIKSILNQTFRDFELIIINDGSAEKYNALLDRVARMDARIFICNQKNAGVSVARNYGVEVSKGMYIAFVDADDVVHHQYLEQALDVIEKNNVEYVVGANLEVFSNKADYAKENALKPMDEAVPKIYEGSALIDLIPCFVAVSCIIRFSNGGYINRGTHARLLKADVAKKTLFPEGVAMGEDIIWNQYVLKLCSRVAIVENIWYYYIKNELSSVHRYRENAVDVAQMTGVSLFESVKDVMNDGVYRAFCETVISQIREIVFLAYLTNAKNVDPFWKKQRFFCGLKKKYPWKYITWRYAKLGNMRDKVLFFLYWSNLYFLAAYIRDKLHR